VAATPASVGVVRSELRHDLAVLPAPVREDAELVLTELLGNAMRHGRALGDGALAVSWVVGEIGVEIAVTDGGGPTLPVVIDAAPTQIGGRGLSIVSMLAASWGVDRHDAETTVWAIVPVPARSLSRV
jgi:anti-sigma regulatory factor (Ser/Thr protein kinase)